MNNYKAKKVMKKLASLLTCICLILSTTACSQSKNYSSGNWGSKKVIASNKYVTKDIKVDNFKKISVAGSPDVTFTQKSGRPEVEVYTSDNIVDLLDIKVKDNTLYIGFKKDVNVSYKKLEVRVSAETLNGISVAGSGDVFLKNGLQTNDNLSINVAGSGDIKGSGIKCNDMKVSVAGSGDINADNIACNNLKVSVAGSGDMVLRNVTATGTEASVAGSGSATITGITQTATYSVAGSGDLLTEGYEAQRVTASVAGSGSIKCFATEFLKARTSGSGKIGYKGNPELDYPKKSLYKL